MRRPSSGGVGATDPAAAQSRSTVDGVPAASAGGRRNWWAFFVLGTINNLGYVVVLSGAKSISRYFHALKWIGLLNWADVGLSFVARGAATSLAGRPGWPFQLRININSALMLIGERSRLRCVYTALTCCCGCSVGLHNAAWLCSLLTHTPALPFAL